MQFQYGPTFPVAAGAGGPQRTINVVMANVLVCVAISSGCGRFRFDLATDTPVDVGLSDASSAGDGGDASRPTVVRAEDGVFWDDGGGDGESVTVEGTNYVAGLSTVYLSADGSLGADDVPQVTTFVSSTQVSFVANRGTRPQGDMFLFVTNDQDLSVADPSLTSDALPVAVGRRWTPGDAGGVAAWWDASDPSSVLEADSDPAEVGDSVFRWMDKSGNGNHLNQRDTTSPIVGTATLGSRGRRGLGFAGGRGEELEVADSPTLDLDGTGGVNIFAVVRAGAYVDRGSGINVILSKGLASSSHTTYALSMRAGVPLVFQSGANSLPGGGVSDSDLIVAGASNSSDPLTYLNVDGAQVSQTAAKGASDNGSVLVVGDDNAANDRHANFILGELVLVGGNLPPDVVANFEGYLAHRWGIPLDSAHPHAVKFTAVVFDTL